MNMDGFKVKYRVVETLTDRVLDRLALGPFSAAVAAAVLLGAIAFGIWVSR